MTADFTISENCADGYFTLKHRGSRQSSALNMPSAQCYAKTRVFSPSSCCKLVEIARSYNNSYRRETGRSKNPADCPLITAKSGHSFSYETTKPKNELGDVGEIICIYKIRFNKFLMCLQWQAGCGTSRCLCVQQLGTPSSTKPCSEPGFATAEATALCSASLNSFLGQESGKPTLALPVKPCNYTWKLTLLLIMTMCRIKDL